MGTDFEPGELSALTGVHAETESNPYGGDEVSLTRWMRDSAQDDPKPTTGSIRRLLDGLVAKGLLIEVHNLDDTGPTLRWRLTDEGETALGDST